MWKVDTLPDQAAEPLLGENLGSHSGANEVLIVRDMTSYIYIYIYIYIYWYTGTNILEELPESIFRAVQETCQYVLINSGFPKRPIFDTPA
jgi:hypothetical protein